MVLDDRHLEVLFEDVGQIGEKILPKNEYYAQLQLKQKQRGGSVQESQLKEVIYLFRITGLLKRKYYQISSLGTFFKTQKLPIVSYVRYFQETFPSLFSRSLAQRLTLDQYSSLYIECSKWYITSTMERDFSGYQLQVFQQVLNTAFEWELLPIHLADHARQVINEFLRHQYREDHAIRTIKFHPTMKPVNTVPQQPSPPVKSREAEWGRVLQQVLVDIYFWMVTCLSNKDYFRYEEPFFDIQAYAEKHHPIKLPNYTRAVSWLLKKNLSSRDEKYLERLPPLAEIGMDLKEVVTLLRINVTLHYLKVFPNKFRRVLIFSTTGDHEISALAEETTYLQFFCGECLYFEPRRKKDCLLFRRLEYLHKKGYTTIPEQYQGLYNQRIQPIFSTKVACSFWRTKQPINGTHYPIGQDLGRMNPQLRSLVTKPIEDQVIPVVPKNQRFDPQTDNPSLVFTRPSEYVYITETDVIHYVKNQELLRVNETDNHLTMVTLIDTRKWDRQLQELTTDFRHLKVNYRPFNITVSVEDHASIQHDHQDTPILQITRHRQKSKEKYPLHHLATVYNVGKPRLNRPLKKWNVGVIYSSTKGILATPSEKIRDAILLPGVRRVLQTRHIQGLMVSAINAVLYLAELARGHNQEEFATLLINRLGQLLSQGAPRLLEAYQQIDESSFRQVGLLEAWISRPFAEGVREYVRIIQDQSHPLIQRPYGRTVARRVKKQNKQGLEFMGGYTPFDAALNSLNRTLRHRLRLWNAKAGLGFKTIPLFVHTSRDKPGRAGHLDLEEVGRIISRMVLVEAIAKGTIKRHHFQEKYDDDYLPYYIPYANVVRWFRGYLVRTEILSTELYYSRQWLPFSQAHQQHVQHLCSCLERSGEIPEEESRTAFLSEIYQPLIFQPRIPSNQFKQEIATLIST